MKIFLKLLLAIVLWSLFLGLCIAASLLFEQPIELGLRVFLFVFVIWYTVKLCGFLYRRWRAKQRVEKLIKQDNAAPLKNKLSIAAFLFPSSVSKHLSRLWARLSHKRLDSEPSLNQQLRWLMHIPLGKAKGQWLNEPGAIRPQWDEPVLTENEYTQWVLFNEFMVLDVQAYLLQQQNEIAQGQWFEWLDALSYCKKRPVLDGLIVSLDINQLADPSQRDELADHLRLLVEQIKTHCATDVAITFMFEGLEQLSGVGPWVETLSVGEHSSPLGSINASTESFEQLVTRVIDYLSEHLHRGSLYHLMHQGFDSEAAALPSSVKQLTQQLAEFGRRCLNANRFQSACRVNGVFFTASQNQHYAFISQLLEGQLLLKHPAISLDLVTFSDKQKRKKLLLGGVLSFAVILVLGLLESNERENVTALFDQFQSNYVKQQDLVSNSQNLNQKYQLIQKLSEIQLNHWLPLHRSVIDSEALNTSLLAQMDVMVMGPLAKTFGGKLQDIDGRNDQRIDYLNILIRRANLLQAVLAGASDQQLLALPQPYDSYFIEQLDEQQLQHINDLYLNYLKLQRAQGLSTARVEWTEALEANRQQVVEILLNSQGNMQWLIDWVNLNSSSAQFKASDYWPQAVNNEPTVAAAYTLVGNQKIDQVLQQITDVLGQKHPFTERFISQFRQQYRLNYLTSWKTFLEQFMAGKQGLTQRRDWLAVINNLPTGRNIFFQLLNDADQELGNIEIDEERDEWVVFLRYYQLMLAQSSDTLQTNDKQNKVFTKLALKVIGAAGSVGKVISKSGKSSLKTKKKLDKAAASGAGPSERELNLLAAAETLDSYKKHVAESVFSIEQLSLSLQNMAGLYDNASQPSAAKTPLGQLQKQLDTLHALIGQRSERNQGFWQVFTGPLQLLLEFMRQDAGCQLNQGWQDDFLFQLYGVPEYKLTEVAYGESGLLWQHYQQQLQSFIKAGVAGNYGLKQSAGRTMPIEQGFIRYLSQAKDSMQGQTFGNFNLDLTVAPTSVNQHSMLYVANTEIRMQCAETAQSIINRNFIDTQSLQWDDTCNRLELLFQLGNRSLVKQFVGRDGMIEFLDMFASGKARFDAESFAEHFYLLQQYDVRYLDVSISVLGGKKLRDQLVKRPPLPPKHIAQCWKVKDGL